MTRSARHLLHLWYGIFLALFTVVIAVLFAAQAADLYFSGVGYSRELVVERVTMLAVPFWLWIAAIAVGGVLVLVFPPEKKILKRIPDDRKTVEHLVRMAGESESEKYEAAKSALQKESKVRRIVWICCLAVCLVCMGIALAFIFNFPAYPNVDDYPVSEPNAAVYDAILMLVRSVLPCAAVAFVACLGATIYDAVSAKRILPQAKILLAEGGRAQTVPAAGGKAALLDSPRTLLIVRIAVFAVAIALIIWGILNGGAGDVLAKAVAICTECIGLG